VRSIRKLILLAVLGFTVLLTILSVVGAFLGADVAGELFNSPLLVVIWILITALFLAGFVCFKTLVRSPGGLMCHLGVTLILIGAMYGSHLGHGIAASYLGIERTPEGYMQISEGQASNAITDQSGQAIGILPFEVKLEDFWIEYYDTPSPWRLGVDAPPRSGSSRRQMAEIAWNEGEVADIPFLGGATVEVIRYLPSARAQYREGAVPTLEVVEADGRTTAVPARVGEEVELSGPGETLRIARVFGHLQIRGGEVIDIPESYANPAVQVRLKAADGSTSRRYAFARPELADHANGQSGLQLHYAMPTELVAVADSTTRLPAMEVKVSGPQGEEMHEWLIARSIQQSVVLPLTAITGVDQHPPGQPHRQAEAYLVLAGVQGMISDYKSQLTVLDHAGERQAEKVIEVNDPLHYGDYHFYQHSYDSRQGRFTILGVHSDAGLSVVYVGFALLCL